MTRKYVIIPALCVGLIGLASCCNEYQNFSVAGGAGEIRFGGRGLGVEVKAFVETDNNELKSNGFKVAAIIDDGGSMMFNSVVSYDSNGSYSVPGKRYFFPIGRTMSFYAVYPPTETIDVTGGVATLRYEQDADKDLIIAKATGVPDNGDSVSLTFEHILSQVSIKVKGGESSVDYKVKRVKITDASGGTYTFADGIWTPGGTTIDVSIYDNSGGIAVGTSLTDIGNPVSVIPGSMKLNVVWECYNKGTSTAVSSKDVTVDISLPQGKHTTLNLTLPFDSTGMTFDTSLGAWATASENIVVKPKEFVFTVDYAGKKVKFAPGNLYWDGSEFKFEEHQYDSPNRWDKNHVGHFFWSKDASVACAEDYSDDGGTTEDKFFAADGGAIESYTVLSDSEWQYLIDNAIANNESVIDGKYCVILKPDGFSGAVQDTYTAAEWAIAESAYGLVALPFAGTYDLGIDFYGTDGDYWSSIPDADDVSSAWYGHFSSEMNEDVRSRNRGIGLLVRLVQVQ